MYIDTHCHIIKSEYDNIDEVISKLEGNIAIISGDSESTNKEVMEVIEKYPNTDALYLTATPIPRTLGLTFFGDKIINKNTFNCNNKLAIMVLRYFQHDYF